MHRVTRLICFSTSGVQDHSWNRASHTCEKDVTKQDKNDVKNQNNDRPSAGPKLDIDANAQSEKKASSLSLSQSVTQEELSLVRTCGSIELLVLARNDSCQSHVTQTLPIWLQSDP